VTAEPAAAALPRRRLPWVLLALSLALNLCFVGGALWFHLRKPPWRMTPAERIERMQSELQLDAAHEQLFRRYYRTLFARLQLMRAEVQPLVADAWAEIAKPQPDEAKIAKLFDQAAETRRKYQRQLTSETLAFLATLTPQQRATFVQLARRPPPSWAQPIHRGVSP
jgi:Spy/CpxP family protein refolding chaperone